MVSLVSSAFEVGRGVPVTHNLFPPKGSVWGWIESNLQQSLLKYPKRANTCPADGFRLVSWRKGRVNQSRAHPLFRVEGLERPLRPEGRQQWTSVAWFTGFFLQSHFRFCFWPAWVWHSLVPRPPHR